MNYWEENQRDGCFNEFPKRLQALHPDTFGKIDEERLGVLCALLWLYLGEKAVNEATLMKWFRDSLSQ